MMVQPGTGCRPRAASHLSGSHQGPAWGFSRLQRHTLGLELSWKEAAVASQDGKHCGPGSWGLRAWVDDRLVVEVEQLPYSDEEEEDIQQQRLSGSEASAQAKGADGGPGKIQLPTYSLATAPQAAHQPPYGGRTSGVGGHGNGKASSGVIRESSTVGGASEVGEADYVQGVLLTCFYGGSKQEWAAPRDTAVRLGAFSVYT